MYPDFTAEELGFRDVLQDFLRRECGTQVVRRNHSSEGPDLTVWKGLADLGLFATCVPEAYDGLAAGLRQVVLPLEETAAALVPGPVAETLAFTECLAEYGDDELKQRLLPRIASGELMATIALLDEPHHYAPEDALVKATRSEGKWLLSGRKILVPDAAACGAMIVSAQTVDGGPVMLFVVESGAAGLSLRKHQTIDPGGRYYAIELSEVAAVPISLDGTANRRLHQTAAWMATAQLTGIASHALDMAVKYAGDRKQFGQPIGAFQAIKHMCADMHVGREMSRAASRHAGWELAAGMPDAAIAVSVAKAFAADACRSILYDCLQVHGGIGFTWEYDLHLYIKRGKYLEHAYGNATWHREAIARNAIAREALEAA